MASLDILQPGENKTLKQNHSNAIAKIAIISLLSLFMSGNTFIHSHEKKIIPLGQIDEPKNDNVADESLDIMSEQLFKAAVAQALAPINDLQDIPTGGIPLVYPASVGENLPTTINFYPKKMIAETLPFTIIMIGKTMFVVTPELGFVVDDMYIDKTTFNIKVSQQTIFGQISKEVSKTKSKEMPDYLARLLKEGDKGRYIGSSIKVVTSKEQQVEYIKKINELNK